MSQPLLVVDDEQAAEGEALVLLVHAVRLRDGGRLVGEQGDVERAEAALFARSVHPGEVTEVAVRRAGDELAVDLAELLGAIGERYDLGRADERAVGKRTPSVEWR